MVLAWLSTMVATHTVHWLLFPSQPAQGRPRVPWHCSVPRSGASWLLCPSSHGEICLTAALQGHPIPSRALSQQDPAAMEQCQEGSHPHTSPCPASAVLHSTTNSARAQRRSPSRGPPGHDVRQKHPRALRQPQLQHTAVKVSSEPSVLVRAAEPTLRGSTVNIADSWIQFIRRSAETIIREGDK